MRIGHTIVELSVTTSTMDDIERLAAEGAEEGLVVVAEEQTAGRGRAGRGWTVPAGTALLCSILLQPSLPADRLSTLPLIAGVAVAEAIEDRVPVRCRLKWPNDVWIDGRKVAGILMTAATTAGRVDRVMLGIGVNVSGGVDDLPPNATSLAAAAEVDISRAELLKALISRLQVRYDGFIADQGRGDLVAWTDRAAMLGELVTVEDGGHLLSGRFRGVDLDGALLIDVAGSVLRVVAGDLSRGPRPI